MPLIPLRATGHLNKDIDINSMPDGDYADAKNIIIGTGLDGGDASLRLIESIKTSGLTPISGTIKAILQHSTGKVYVLTRIDATDAKIVEIAIDLSTSVDVLTYTHSVSVDFTPDLKIVGDILVWNYHAKGTVLSWSLTRDNGATPTIDHLVLAKSPPVEVFGIVKNLTSNQGREIFEKYDYQFACRYKFDTGESSVLSAYSEMFKGEADTSSYAITLTLDSAPEYATGLEIFTKSGSSGTWRRISTIVISAAPSSISWVGEVYESLDLNSSVISFSAIPVNAKHIEIAKDRIFLADFEDDYKNDATGSLVMSISDGYTLATGGANKNYLGADALDSAINSTESGTYYKPFANNSVYSLGVAFFDSAHKTRGIEYVSEFKTGQFAYPIIPSVTLTLTGDARPSWAKYMQLCITKNQNKANIYEGYANSIYFETEDDERIRYALSIAEDALSKVKFLVVDISGMYNSGRVYSFNQGDRITINVPDGTDDSTDGEGNSTGAYRVIDVEVVSSDSNSLRCKWSGGPCENDKIPVASELYFEIYTPRQQAEERNLQFYGTGEVIDITSSMPTTISGVHLGDMVFSKISFKEYTDQFLAKGFIPSSPAVVVADQTTIVKSTKISGNVDSLGIADTTGTNSLAENRLEITFDTIEVDENDDSATIVNTVPQIRGYYDSNTKITVNHAFDILITMGANTELDISFFRVYCQLFKLPFDYETNTYSSEEAIGDQIRIYKVEKSLDDASASLVGPQKASVEVDLQQYDVKLGFGDRIKLAYTLTAYSEGSIDSIIEMKQRSGVTEPFTITIVGDRITPVKDYTKRTTVDTEASDSDFIIRATSNFSNPIEWNTSAGKPYLKSVDTFSDRRTNSIRHGGNIVYGTAVNNLSSFVSLDTVDVPKENGDIMSLQRANRLQGEGDMLLAVCQREATYLLLGEYKLTNADNSSLSTISSDLIGTIRNLGEAIGMSNKASIYNRDGDIFWWDNYKKHVVRFNKKGLTVISDLKMKSEFIGKDGVAKFAYDPFYDMIHVNVGGTTSFGFSERRNGWMSEYEMDYNFGVHYGDMMLLFNGGSLFKSLQTSATNKYGELLGTAKQGFIKYVMNSGNPIYPEWIRVNHSMDVVDYSQPNHVEASLIGIVINNENGQETNISEGMFDLEDNLLYSSVYRDTNSAGGLIEGDHMRGSQTTFGVTLKDNTQDNRIFVIDVEVSRVLGH